MNVCLAMEKFDPRVGGAERYCWGLASYLAAKGHGVSVICMKASDEPLPGVRVIRVPALRAPQFMRHLSFAVLHFLKARSLKDHLHFCVGNTFFMDVYQPHGGVHRAWFLKETAAFPEPRRSVVRALRRASPKDMVQRALEWWTYKVARPRVIAISNMVASDMKRMFGYRDSMISLIPNGIDLVSFSPDKRVRREEVRGRYGLGADEFVFLFVAQNPRLKGFDVLVEACGLLAGSRPFRVLAIGHHDPGMERSSERRGGRVVFGGRSDDLAGIYPACDCLVHPTYYDACSLVVLESLASGTPVITTDANGAAMFVTRENGLVVSPGDAAGLAGAMRDMMDAPGSAEAPENLADAERVFAEVENVMRSEWERRRGPGKDGSA